jgi:hypothetical protein
MTAIAIAEASARTAPSSKARFAGIVLSTAVLGAILWTGYLGGAIATHLNAESPLFTHTIFPIYVAALIWGGLYLRDARVRALIRR